jgi:2-desacetyl-2-hydroxyethyl bacteriochlorophyllide A dehydrogenase
MGHARMGGGVNRTSLVFEKPRTVSLKTEAVPEPGPDEVLVQTRFSAVSSGTERLFYRGRVPEEMALDTDIPALAGSARYPFKYGYAAAGRVIGAGSDVPDGWTGRRVFAFHPHESHFTARPADLHELPDEMAWRDGVFLPNMETAVNFLMDGRPVIGETVVIFGMGIVGLLTAAVLVRFPLWALIAVDPCADRRELAGGLGAFVHPADPESLGDVISELTGGKGPDLIYEVSGSPAALNQAVDMAGFDTRIVVGSWYGSSRSSLDLGGRFHRNRIRIESSQVSTLAPAFQGRWSHRRRLAMAMAMIREIGPARFISHEFDFSRAPEAYDLLDRTPDEVLQAVFRYGD